MSRAPLDLSFLTLPRYEADLMGEMVIPGGSGIVSSDWHLPLTCEDSVRHLISHARKNKATDWLVCAGDWFNLDVLSDYLPKQADHTLMDEFKMSQRLMRILLGVFDEVHVSLGNHDLRLMKSLGYKLLFEESMEVCFASLPPKMQDKMSFTGRDYILADTPEGTWRFCHTRQYSVNQLTIPVAIADIHQQHTAAGHRHHCSLGYSKSGLWAAELGGLFRADKTSYLNRWSTTHPKWVNGYMVLKEGVPSMPMLSSSRLA